MPKPTLEEIWEEIDRAWELHSAVEQRNKAKEEWLNAVADRAIHLYHFYLITKGKLDEEVKIR